MDLGFLEGLLRYVQRNLTDSHYSTHTVFYLGMSAILDVEQTQRVQVYTITAHDQHDQRPWRCSYIEHGLVRCDRYWLSIDKLVTVNRFLTKPC
ncbi:hypothetical protein Trydic_g10915 [Trypoxylus dichotomus]